MQENERAEAITEKQTDAQIRSESTGTEIPASPEPNENEGQSARVNAGFAAMRRRYEKEIACLKAREPASDSGRDGLSAGAEGDTGERKAAGAEKTAGMEKTAGTEKIAGAEKAAGVEKTTGAERTADPETVPAEGGLPVEAGNAPESGAEAKAGTPVNTEVSVDAGASSDTGASAGAGASSEAPTVQINGESGENPETEQIRLRLDYLRELADISRYDPAIRTPEDLEADPEIERVRELISRGNTLADAWLLAHRQQIFERARAEGRKTALDESAPPAYPPVGSVPDIYVTPEERALFRAVIPGITDTEIRAAARKYRT